jgi:hypothetical protein
MSNLEEVIHRYLLYRPFTLRDLVDPPPVAGPFPEPWHSYLEMATPHPQPWLEHVGKLIQAVSVQVELREQMLRQAETAINAQFDEPELCPRPPKRPWPGPDPRALLVIEELVMFASLMPDGAMREGLLKVIGQLAERSFAA